MKNLLIVFHTKSGKTRQMADAVISGATQEPLENVSVVVKNTFDADARDLLDANALILGTPENFGYMSGAMKDFFDRTFYEVEGRIQALPYAVFISAGNDGTGALTAIQRIAKGYPFIQAQEPIVCQGELNDETLERCSELGLTMAMGLEAGVI